MSAPRLSIASMPAGDVRQQLMSCYERMLQLQERQVLISDLTERLHDLPRQTDEFQLAWDALVEAETEAIFEEMHQLSVAAASLTSASKFDLYFKARIWQMRRICENDDEVTRIAAAICQDICDLAE